MTSAASPRQYGAGVTEPAPPPALVRHGLVALLVAAGLVESLTVDPEDSPRAVVVLCTLAATCLMSLWWRLPEVSAAAAIGAIAVKDAFGGPGEVLTLLVCGVLATFGVGSRLPARRATWALAGLLTLAAVGVFLGPESAVSELVFSAIAIGLPWSAGRLVRASRDHASLVQELAESREREARDQARFAIADERARIAREVHDLVGHSVSTMILQAGAAEEVFDGTRTRHSARCKRCRRQAAGLSTTSTGSWTCSTPKRTTPRGRRCPGSTGCPSCWRASGTPGSTCTQTSPMTCPGCPTGSAWRRTASSRRRSPTSFAMPASPGPASGSSGHPPTSGCRSPTRVPAPARPAGSGRD